MQRLEYLSSFVWKGNNEFLKNKKKGRSEKTDEMAGGFVIRVRARQWKRIVLVIEVTVVFEPRT